MIVFTSSLPYNSLYPKLYLNIQNSANMTKDHIQVLKYGNSRIDILKSKQDICMLNI